MRRQFRIRSLSRQGAQAMTEMVIVLPVFYLLIFGSIQIALIFSAKTTLNYATFQAARLGAVNNATYTGIRRGLIRGLAPLFTTSDDLDGMMADIELGVVDNRSDNRKKNARDEVDRYTRIIRVNPTMATFEEGSGLGRVSPDDSDIVEIPSDNLMYRSSVPAMSGQNIQDANLLKIKVQYCYELMVPMVNRVIGSLSELNNTRTNYAPQELVSQDRDGVASGMYPDGSPKGDKDPRFADFNVSELAKRAGTDGLGSYSDLCSCSARPDSCGGDIGELDRNGNSTGFVISAEAIVRMQSPAYDTDPDEELGNRMCDGDYMACP